MLRGKRALALKAPITTAADETFWNNFSNFRKNEVWYSMRLVCWQAILMKHHAFFVIFEKAAKFELVVCCKLYVGGALWVFVAVYLFLVVKLNSFRAEVFGISSESSLFAKCYHTTKRYLKRQPLRTV